MGACYSATQENSKGVDEINPDHENQKTSFIENKTIDAPIKIFKKYNLLSLNLEEIQS